MVTSIIPTIPLYAPTYPVPLYDVKASGPGAASADTATTGTVATLSASEAETQAARNLVDITV